MTLHAPDPVLQLLHSVLRKLPARPLHTPLLSWTTVTVESSTCSTPALSLSCWLMRPQEHALRLSLSLRVQPTGQVAIRTDHIPLHTMLVHAMEQNPSAVPRCLAALRDLYPAMPPRTEWHISRPVPIDGIGTLPPAAPIHAAAAAIAGARAATLRIEIDRHAGNPTPARAPRPAARLHIHGADCGEDLPEDLRRLLTPPGKIAQWLAGAFPKTRYRTLTANTDTGSAACQHALDSLCPLIEIHNASPARE